MLVTISVRQPYPSWRSESQLSRPGDKRALASSSQIIIFVEEHRRQIKLPRSRLAGRYKSCGKKPYSARSGILMTKYVRKFSRIHLARYRPVLPTTVFNNTAPGRRRINGDDTSAVIDVPIEKLRRSNRRDDRDEERLIAAIAPHVS